jgi:hypothetical protein
MKKSADPNQPPTLKNLALDHIGALAAELRKADPTLTKEAAVSKAARSPEGYQAYRLYRTAGAELPVFQAINQIVKRELAKGEGGAGTMRDVILGKRAALAKANPLPSMAGGRTATAQPVVTRPPASAITLPNPAAAIYGAIHAAALEAFPGIQEAVAVARFVATPAGEEMHRRYAAAKLIEQG